MITIFGDSHAYSSFIGLYKVDERMVAIHSQPSMTMHRVGRDNELLHCSSTPIIQHNYKITKMQNSTNTGLKSTFVFLYGEVDCRCHIQKQIDLGRDEDDIIKTLVEKYFQTIANNISKSEIQESNRMMSPFIFRVALREVKSEKPSFSVIVVGITPPLSKMEYETIHGPITHEFPFVGTDECRVRYTRKMNDCIKKMCSEYGYYFFGGEDVYGFYTDPNGCLKFELSDSNVHIGQNGFFLSKFTEFLKEI